MNKIKLNKIIIILCIINVIFVIGIVGYLFLLPKNTHNDVIEKEAISLSKTDLTLKINSTDIIEAIVVPSDSKVIWSSSDNKVVTVDNEGMVTAKKAGNAVVTAKVNNVSASCNISVIYQSYNNQEDLCNDLVNSGAKYLDYKSFVDMFPNQDDYYAIKATHDCANKYQLDVKVTQGTYNIYKNKEKNNPIIVNTNTDFSDSVIYIHDEEDVIPNYTGYIYEITYDDYSCVSNMNKIALSSNLEYNKVSDSIKSLIENKNSYVRINSQNTNEKVFIRSGSNNSTGVIKAEAFRVGQDGKILDPLFWQYKKGEEISVSVCPMNKEISFQNASFYNIVKYDASYASLNSSDFGNSSYIKRGIQITRNNVNINNIKHMYVDSEKKEITKSNYGYYGFFYLKNAANINLSNVEVYSLENTNNNTSSTYDVTMDYAVNVKLDNVKMHNESMMNNNSWGVTGTNRVKNITYNNCMLNRIDTHTGVYNLTVSNTRVGRYAINQMGFGDLVIENVTIEHNNSFIRLRNDYGSTWNGTITLKGNNFIKPDNDNAVYLVSVNPSVNHNYGYKLYLPDIYMDSSSTFTIQSNTNKFYLFSQSASDLKNKYKYVNVPTINLNGTINGQNNALKISNYTKY